MSWTQTRSSERIAGHLANLGTIEIKRLVREADLDMLLSETVCRQIYGAHVYATIPNFAHLSSDTTLSRDGYARLIRCVHCYQREVSRIVETIFGGVRVHFQGPKLHALFYRPICDAPALATRAVLLQLVLADFMDKIFNEAFPSYADFELASGADIGDVVGTKNGSHGDRELLFVGAPANYAAKMIATGARLSSEIFVELSADLQHFCVFDGDVYGITCNEGQLDALLQENGFSWDREKSKARVEADRDAVPLAEIDYGDATTKITFENLSIRHNKRVVGASLFADVCGFTKYIDEAEDDEAREEALRVFAALRREFAKVVKEDFEGVRVQYQGDRIQAIFHVPKGDRAAIALEAFNAAVALQSSMEITLKQHLPEAASLSIAVGVDLGTTLASFLGLRGQRDRICLGKAVENAAMLEDAHGSRDIAVSAAVYDELSGELQELFTEHTGAYVANGLTVDSVELAQKASVYDSGSKVAVASVLGAAAVGLGIVVAAAGAARADERRREEAARLDQTFTPSRTHGGHAG
jgi:class 3 adenylate cyclase